MHHPPLVSLLKLEIIKRQRYFYETNVDAFFLFAGLDPTDTTGLQVDGMGASFPSSVRGALV